MSYSAACDKGGDFFEMLNAADEWSVAMCSARCKVEERPRRKFDEAKMQALWKLGRRVEQAMVLPGATARQSSEGRGEDIKRTRQTRPADDRLERAGRQTDRQTGGCHVRALQNEWRGEGH